MERQKRKREKELRNHSSRTSFQDFYDLEEPESAQKYLLSSRNYEPIQPFIPPTTPSDISIKPVAPKGRTKNMMCERPPRPKSQARKKTMKVKKPPRGKQDIAIDASNENLPVMTNIKIDTYGNSRISTEFGKPKTTKISARAAASKTQKLSSRAS